MAVMSTADRRSQHELRGRRRTQRTLLLGWAAWLAMSVGGCADAPPPAADRHVFFMNQVQLVLGPEGDGRLGLDLDGVVSTDDGAEACAHHDLVDAEGRDGIDSQLAHLGDLMDILQVRHIINPLVQDYVDEGNMSFLMVVDGLDSFEDDDHVDVSIVRAASRMLDLGNDGFAVPGQSFDRDPGFSTVSGPGAIADGVLTFRTTGELSFPFRLAQVLGDIRLTNLQAEVRLEGDADGGGAITSARGVVGAVASAEDIAVIFDRFAAQDAEINLESTFLRSQLTGFADFDPLPGGFRCQGLSVGMTAGMVNAFLLDDESPSAP